MHDCSYTRDWPLRKSFSDAFAKIFHVFFRISRPISIKAVGIAVYAYYIDISCFEGMFNSVAATDTIPFQNEETKNTNFFWYSLWAPKILICENLINRMLGSGMIQQSVSRLVQKKKILGWQRILGYFSYVRRHRQFAIFSICASMYVCIGVNNDVFCMRNVSRIPAYLCACMATISIFTAQIDIPICHLYKWQRMNRCSF